MVVITVVDEPLTLRLTTRCLNPENRPCKHVQGLMAQLMSALAGQVCPQLEARQRHAVTVQG
jgi:hypothetical protein